MLVVVDAVLHREGSVMDPYGNHRGAPVLLLIYLCLSLPHCRGCCWAAFVLHNCAVVLTIVAGTIVVAVLCFAVVLTIVASIYLPRYLSFCHAACLTLSICPCLWCCCYTALCCCSCSSHQHIVLLSLL